MRSEIFSCDSCGVPIGLGDLRKLTVWGEWRVGQLAVFMYAGCEGAKKISDFRALIQGLVQQQAEGKKR